MSKEGTVKITEGWTQELGPFTILVDGQPFPGGLTGFDVQLTLRTFTGEAVTPGGTLRFANQTISPGQVYYTPVTSDFLAAKAPYRYHFKVTDGSGRVVFFPNLIPETIEVEQA